MRPNATGCKTLFGPFLHTCRRWRRSRRGAWSDGAGVADASNAEAGPAGEPGDDAGETRGIAGGWRHERARCHRVRRRPRCLSRLRRAGRVARLPRARPRRLLRGEPPHYLPIEVRRGQATYTTAGAAGAEDGAKEAKVAKAAKIANPESLAIFERVGNLRQWHPAGAQLLRLDAVAPRAERWLWPGRVPIGNMCVLDGDPDQGKSLITLDLAARISTGRAVPDGSCGDRDGPAGVVLLTAEDDPADTIRQRPDAAGTDAAGVVLLQGVREVRGDDAGIGTAERERG